jgi:hypothetical protein
MQRVLLGLRQFGRHRARRDILLRYWLRNFRPIKSDVRSSCEGQLLDPFLPSFRNEQADQAQPHRKKADRCPADGQAEQEARN